MTSTLQACPECGARLKPSDQQCWLCSLELQGGSLGASRPAKTPTFIKGPATPSSHPKPASSASTQAPQSAPSAVPNPFAEDAGESRYLYKTNNLAMLGHLFALLAILPATGIAFMTTCTVVLSVDGNLGSRNTPVRGIVYLIMCFASALVVFGGFYMLIVSLGKKTVQRVEIK